MEWKLACKISGKFGKFEGVAHVIQHKYADWFSPWYGVVQIIATHQEWMRLSGKDATISLDDGRVGAIQLVTAKHKVTAIQTEDAELGETSLFAFVGLTTLKNPHSPLPASGNQNP